MNTPLEKFKFATIKNAYIEVRETDDSIDIKVRPVQIKDVANKPIKLQYIPFDHMNKGEFLLTDDHKKVEIERSYPIATLDDVDYECDTLYPCERCEKNKHNYAIEMEITNEVKKQNQKLKEVISTIAEMLKGR